MDSTPTSSTPADYLGLKTELQNIAGIIEQYPDHLKQRTFELLITAYLGGGHTRESAPPQAQEAQAVENAPVEAAATGAESGQISENEFSVRLDEPQAGVAPSDLEAQINANIESSTNLLRRRIRLRTMSPMRWQPSA